MKKTNKRRVMAGEERRQNREAAERALSGSTTVQSGPKAPPDWTDAAVEAGKGDDLKALRAAAFLLEPKHDLITRKRQKGLKESRTLLQLFHQIPSEYPENQIGAIISWAGMRKPSRNVTAKAIHALIARLMKPVSVQVQTASDDFKQDMAARAATRAVKGLNAENTSLQVETRMAYDSALTHKGKGYALWEPDERGNLKLRRLDPLSTWVSEDMKEAVFVRYLPRRYVLAKWGKSPEAKEMINDQDSDHPEIIPGVDDEDEMDIEDKIKVTEGYYEAPNGKVFHVVQLSPTDLLVPGEWLEMPLMPVWWIDCNAGFREGTARPKGRNLAPYSYWVNALQHNLYEQLQGQKVHVVYEAGSDPVFPSDTNYQKIKYKKGKTAPVVQIPRTVSEPVRAEAEALQRDALAEVGVSENAAEGSLPGGVTSGIAITKYQNEVAIALSETAHNINIGRLRSARIVCYWCPILYKNKAVLVKADNSDELEAINWRALDMTENTWSVTIAVAGALPETVAGKQQVLDWFAEKGVVTPEHIAEAFDNPDMVRILGEITTPRDLIRMQISLCLDEEEPRIYGPDATQDPKLGLKLTGLAYQRARVRSRIKKIPRKNMDALFRLYQLWDDRVKAQGSTTAQVGAAGAPLPAGSLPATPVTGSAIADQAAAATGGASGVV